MDTIHRDQTVLDELATKIATKLMEAAPKIPKNYDKELFGLVHYDVRKVVKKVLMKELIGIG